MTAQAGQIGPANGRGHGKDDGAAALGPMPGGNYQAIDTGQFVGWEDDPIQHLRQNLHPVPV
jgi:hypothetical protein